MIAKFSLVPVMMRIALVTLCVLTHLAFCVPPPKTQANIPSVEDQDQQMRSGQRQRQFDGNPSARNHRRQYENLRNQQQNYQATTPANRNLGNPYWHQVQYTHSAQNYAITPQRSHLSLHDSFTSQRSSDPAQSHYDQSHNHYQQQHQAFSYHYQSFPMHHQQFQGYQGADDVYTGDENTPWNEDHWEPDDEDKKTRAQVYEDYYRLPKAVWTFTNMPPIPIVGLNLEGGELQVIGYPREPGQALPIIASMTFSNFKVHSDRYFTPEDLSKVTPPAEEKWDTFASPPPMENTVQQIVVADHRQETVPEDTSESPITKEPTLNDQWMNGQFTASTPRSRIWPFFGHFFDNADGGIFVREDGSLHRIMGVLEVGSKLKILGAPKTFGDPIPLVEQFDVIKDGTVPNGKPAIVADLFAPRTKVSSKEKRDRVLNANSAPEHESNVLLDGISTVGGLITDSLETVSSETAPIESLSKSGEFDCPESGCSLSIDEDPSQDVPMEDESVQNGQATLDVHEPRIESQRGDQLTSIGGEPRGSIIEDNNVKGETEISEYEQMQPQDGRLAEQQGLPNEVSRAQSPHKHNVALQKQLDKLEKKRLKRIQKEEKKRDVVEETQAPLKPKNPKRQPVKMSENRRLKMEVAEQARIARSNAEAQERQQLKERSRMFQFDFVEKSRIKKESQIPHKTMQFKEDCDVSVAYDEEPCVSDALDGGDDTNKGEPIAESSEDDAIVENEDFISTKNEDSVLVEKESVEHNPDWTTPTAQSEKIKEEMDTADIANNREQFEKELGVGGDFAKAAITDHFLDLRNDDLVMKLASKDRDEMADTLAQAFIDACVSDLDCRQLPQDQKSEAQSDEQPKPPGSIQQSDVSPDVEASSSTHKPGLHIINANNGAVDRILKNSDESSIVQTWSDLEKRIALVLPHLEILQKATGESIQILHDSYSYVGSQVSSFRVTNSIDLSKMKNGPKKKLRTIMNRMQSHLQSIDLSLYKQAKMLTEIWNHRLIGHPEDLEMHIALNLAMEVGSDIRDANRLFKELKKAFEA